MIAFIDLLKCIAIGLVANSHCKGVYPSDVFSFGGVRTSFILHDFRVFTCKYSGKHQACCSSSAAILHWVCACSDGKRAKIRIVVLDDNRPSSHYSSDEVTAFRLLARISCFHFCAYLMLDN